MCSFSAISTWERAGLAQLTQRRLLADQLRRPLLDGLPPLLRQLGHVVIELDGHIVTSLLLLLPSQTLKVPPRSALTTTRDVTYKMYVPTVIRTFSTTESTDLTETNLVLYMSRHAHFIRTAQIRNLAFSAREVDKRGV
jgi:hypothetical protein